MLDINWRNQLYYYFFFRTTEEYNEENTYEGINYKIKLKYPKISENTRGCEAIIQIEIPNKYDNKLFTKQNPYYSHSVPFINSQEIEDIGHPNKNIYIFKNKFVYPEYPYYISGIVVWHPKTTNLTIDSYQKSHQIARWMIDGLLLHNNKNNNNTT